MRPELLDPRRLLEWRDAIARVRRGYRAFCGRAPASRHAPRCGTGSRPATTSSPRKPGYWRRIIAERMIRNADGTPLERRMFVFDGRVRLTQTIMVEGTALRIAAYHDRDWQRLPWRCPTRAVTSSPSPARRPCPARAHHGPSETR